MKALWDSFLALFEPEDDPNEPFYDPVHLGAVSVACLVTVGVLYWLLWTLLVYEGGLFLKVRAGLSVLLTSKTLLDFGYEGPHAPGAFEGWLGNLIALGLCAAVLAALRDLYRRASRAGPPCLSEERPPSGSRPVPTLGD